jgi:hypothetical protein
MSSLCNHNKKYHNKKNVINEINCESKHKVNVKVNIKSSESNHEQEINENTRKYQCKYCKKEYNYKQSKWRHEQDCKIKKTEIELKNQECLRQKEQIIELQKKLQKTNRIDNKTFKALNKILKERSIINSNNTVNNNIINNNINNYNIVSLGKEEILEALTMQQKKQILDCRLNSLEKLVEITHCGEINQFKNIIITNLKDNYAYKYDEDKGYFVTCLKNQFLDRIITLRLTDIEEIYTELKDAKKINLQTKKVIQTFLDKMEAEDVPVVEGETRYANYRSYKIESIKILLYNNHDNITKNIALLVYEKPPPTDPTDSDVSENIFTPNAVLE